jgi:hypothetical protein
VIKQKKQLAFPVCGSRVRIGPLPSAVGGFDLRQRHYYHLGYWYLLKEQVLIWVTYLTRGGWQPLAASLCMRTCHWLFLSQFTYQVTRPS